MANDLGVPSYIGAGGERIAYHRFGHGPTVALIHGIPTWGYLWRNVIPPLVHDGLEVIAVDLLGLWRFGQINRRRSRYRSASRTSRHGSAQIELG